MVALSGSNVAPPVPKTESPPVQAPRVAPPASAATPSMPAPAAVTHQVWECDHGGQKVYSDQRCGDSPSLRAIGAPNRMPTEPLFVDRQGRYGGDQGRVPDYSSGSASPFDPNQDSAECADLRAIVDTIHERMRHPYTSPEGDYYRGRLREISARQYDLNCVR